jgi:hypothetical protein
MLKKQIIGKDKPTVYFNHKVAKQPYSYSKIWDSEPQEQSRQAGIIIDNSKYSPYNMYVNEKHEKHHTLNHCFQAPCSTTFRCEKKSI